MAAASKIFKKITAAAESGDVLTADGLAERLIVFGVPEPRSWRLFDLLDEDEDAEVTQDEFVQGFAHYTALVNEFTSEDGGATAMDVHQLPPECMTIVLSYLGRPAELVAVAQSSSRLRAAAAADGVWAPIFRCRAWASATHRQLAAQLEQIRETDGAEADWSTVVKALPSQAMRSQVASWSSWRECFRGALRQESWIVAELGATEIRIGSAADPAPACYPLPPTLLPPAVGATSSSTGHNVAGGWQRWPWCSGRLMAEIFCDALSRPSDFGPGMPAEGASLCVVASPFESPATLTELTEALAERSVHRLQFITASVAALECARRPRYLDDNVDSDADGGNGSAAVEPPPPSGVVVMLTSHGCYAAAVVNGRQANVPTDNSRGKAVSLSRKKEDTEKRARGLPTRPSLTATVLTSGASSGGFLPPINSSSVVGLEMGAMAEASTRPRTRERGDGRPLLPGAPAVAACNDAKEAGLIAPSTLSLYGCEALAADVASAIAAAGNAALAGQGQGLQQSLHGAEVLYGLRSQITSVCYVRACPANARPVSDEERVLCRAAYEIPLPPRSNPRQRRLSAATTAAVPAPKGGIQQQALASGSGSPALGAAAAAAFVQQARLQQLKLGGSSSGTAVAAAPSGASGQGHGISRFMPAQDARGLRPGGARAVASSISVAMRAVAVDPSSPSSPPPATAAAAAATAATSATAAATGASSSAAVAPGNGPAATTTAAASVSSSLVVELGEDRFSCCEALLNGRRVFAGGGAAARGGAAGLMGALTQLADEICDTSRYSDGELAELAGARQLVLAGEGALFQGLPSRLAWEVRQRDRNRTAPLGRLLRGAQMIALTHPRPEPRLRPRAYGRSSALQLVGGEPAAAAGEDEDEGEDEEKAAPPVAAAGSTRLHKDKPRRGAAASQAEARAVCWYGAKIHALRVERTGGFLKSSGGAADAMRMASGRAWLTLTVSTTVAPTSGATGAAGEDRRRTMKDGELAEALSKHLRFRAGFPLLPTYVHL